MAQIDVDLWIFEKQCTPFFCGFVDSLWICGFLWIFLDLWILVDFCGFVDSLWIFVDFFEFFGLLWILVDFCGFVDFWKDENQDFFTTCL